VKRQPNDLDRRQFANLLRATATGTNRKKMLGIDVYQGARREGARWLMQQGLILPRKRKTSKANAPSARMAS
jgi:hypothetical protein